MPQWDDPRPGFRWPVAAELQIAASAGKLWEAISMPGNLEHCHPFCEKNPVQVWPGEQSHDEILYLNGRVFERRFCRWIDGVGYDLEIAFRRGKASFVSWRIAPAGDQDSILRIAVYPHLLQDLPAAIRWPPHIFYIGPLLRTYLSSVVRGFEWYVIRGEPVPRNQFGSHPWFSLR